MGALSKTLSCDCVHACGTTRTADESQLTNAELAYYLEVTNRVSQKQLSVAG